MTGLTSLRFSLKRLFPSYLLCFVPFLVFGTRNDLRLILWKIAVVGAGLLVFHFARKSMFPYIDLKASLRKMEKTDDGTERIACGLVALAEALLVSSMALAILLSMAGGI